MNISEVIQEMEAGALINYTALYAQYVEFPTSYAGTQPPFTPIFKWVQRKWGDLDGGLKDAGKPASNVEQQQRNVAWIVVKAIAAHGTKAVYFGTRGMEFAQQHAPRIAQQYENSNDPDAPRKIVGEVANTGFTKSQEIISQEATDTGNLLQSGSVAVVDPSELPPPTAGGHQ